MPLTAPLVKEVVRVVDGLLRYVMRKDGLFSSSTSVMVVHANLALLKISVWTWVTTCDHHSLHGPPWLIRDQEVEHIIPCHGHVSTGSSRTNITKVYYTIVWAIALPAE